MYLFPAGNRYIRGVALILLLPWAQSQNLTALPDGPGKDTFVSVCSLCHDPSAPMGKQWTRQEWELKVIEMLHGAARETSGQFDLYNISEARILKLLGRSRLLQNGFDATELNAALKSGTFVQKLVA